MARADLLIDNARTGAVGKQGRYKQHHLLANRLAAHLQLNGHSKPTAPITSAKANARGGHALGLISMI